MRTQPDSFVEIPSIVFMVQWVSLVIVNRELAVRQSLIYFLSDLL